MDFVTILRDLWRRRTLVGLVLLLAASVGIMVAYRVSFPPRLESRKHVVGISSARILIDTPNSQVVEVAPTGSDTLGTRASLLASLMVDGVVKSAIAERAGLRPSELIGVSQSAAEDSAPAGPRGRSASVMTTRVITNSSGEQLPIIDVQAQAPDAQRAARLASAAVTGLRAYLESKAALQSIPEAKRLQVTGLGVPQAADVVRGSHDLLALVAVIVIFVGGCASILVAFSLARDWREASQDEVPLDLEEPLPRRGEIARWDQPDRSAATPSSPEPLRKVRGV
jgi:hypothetical protein